MSIEVEIWAKYYIDGRSLAAFFRGEHDHIFQQVVVELLIVELWVVDGGNESDIPWVNAW